MYSYWEQCQSLPIRDHIIPDFNRSRIGNRAPRLGAFAASSGIFPPESQLLDDEKFLNSSIYGSEFVLIGVEKMYFSATGDTTSRQKSITLIA